MSLKRFFWRLGYLWGRFAVTRYYAFLRWRSARFRYSIKGAEHLSGVDGKSYLLICNHIFPRNNELWPLYYLPLFRVYHHSPDSFALYTVIKKATNRIVKLVSISGNMYWSDVPWRLWLQKNVSQVFLRGIFETLPDMILIEKVKVVAQRGLLAGIEAAVERGDPILIFPQTGAWAQTKSAADIGSLAPYTAIKYSLPIVPACIVNSHSWKLGHKVTVEFGEPFYAGDMKKNELARLMLAKIRTLYSKYASFLFLASSPEAWAVSDDLWCQTAIHLALRGHRVTVFKTSLDRSHHWVEQMAKAGIVILDPTAEIKVDGRLIRSASAAVRGMPTSWLAEHIRMSKPELVVISQPGSHEGLDLLTVCQETGLPYMLISQSPSALVWPADNVLEPLRRAYTESKHTIFVTEYSRAISERQLGLKLADSEVIYGLSDAASIEPVAWPAPLNGRYKMACVTRAHSGINGQYTLLLLLSQAKWKVRPVDITFYGSGNSMSLAAIAAEENATHIQFEEYDWFAANIWSKEHILISPSSREELNRNLIDAMFCGRPAVVANVGGAGEYVVDGECGVVAHGSDLDDLDDALDRAWHLREQWKTMGEAAAKRIRNISPASPGKALAERLEEAYSAML